MFVVAGSCSVCAKTQPESKCPELLANYCDMLLRKTPLSKKLTSEEVEKKLKDVVSTVLKGHCMGLNLPRETAKFGRPARGSTVST